MIKAIVNPLTRAVLVLTTFKLKILKLTLILFTFNNNFNKYFILQSQNNQALFVHTKDNYSMSALQAYNHETTLNVVVNGFKDRPKRATIPLCNTF